MRASFVYCVECDRHTAHSAGRCARCGFVLTERRGISVAATQHRPTTSSVGRAGQASLPKVSASEWFARMREAVNQ